MKISILTPIRNVEKYIKDMVDSVVRQTHQDWELLIMDGASTDSTLDVLKRFEHDPRIRVYSEPDENAWHACDKAFDLVTGDAITIICGQDGILDERWLERVNDVLEQDSSVSLVWALTEGMTEDGILDREINESYRHFIFKEQPMKVAGNAVRKGFSLLKEIISPSTPGYRRRAIFEKLLSKSTLLRVALFTDRGFSDGLPQKEKWFSYWLKTGLQFPDQSMVIRKDVWMDCIPRYVPGNPTLGFMNEFYFNFNTRRYLPYFIPIMAIFTRMHPGNTAERAPEELHEKFQEYMRNVKKFRDSLTPCERDEHDLRGYKKWSPVLGIELEIKKCLYCSYKTKNPLLAS